MLLEKYDSVYDSQNLEQITKLYKVRIIIYLVNIKLFKNDFEELINHILYYFSQ